MQCTWQFTSTAQLRNPGRRYEVSDELESYFFVLFYMSLHWIINNKPTRLKVRRIFDDVEKLGDGSLVGGEGKLNMYILDSDAVLQDLEFIESPLLTDLVRGLFRFFQSLAHFNYDRRPTSQDAEDAGKLKNCKAIRKLVKDTAKRGNWPKDSDKATIDIYPCQERIDLMMDRKEKADSSLGSISTTLSTGSSESRGSKRKREEDDVAESSKRPKKKP
jgi:hypothetical protein